MGFQPMNPRENTRNPKKSATLKRGWKGATPLVDIFVARPHSPYGIGDFEEGMRI
jgi:hypothetical protein